MVDIALEILASSVPLRNGYMPRYRVKTWWAHIDVPPDVTFIKLPRLPMIQPFLVMTGKDTTIFVETWQDHKNAIVGSGGGDAGLPVNRTIFLGMTTCSVDEQLKTPTLNPSVQWLDVHDPIEDESRGKLLVKVDAKFVLPETSSSIGNRVNSPSRSENRHSLQGGDGSELESPIKMIQSPRRTHAANFPFDYNSSPGMHQVSSRKSDTSVFSIRSVSSTRSQDQWVQTDLSLPIIPDISKYTAALQARTSSAIEKTKSATNQNHRSGSEEMSSSSATNTAVPGLVDPLKFAEDILMRSLSNNNDNNNGTGGVKGQTQRRTSEPVSHTSGRQQGLTSTSANSSSEFRRSCLVRQQQHQNGVVNTERRHSKNYDMESLEDVIDMLNHEGQMDAVFSSPVATSKSSNTRQRSVSATVNSTGISSNDKPPLPRSSAGTTTRQSDTNAKVVVGITKLPSSSTVAGVRSNRNAALKRESISSTSSSFQRQESSSPVNSGTDTVRDDGASSPFYPRGRFKEIHFDGAQAKQQATSILMTRTTAQSASNPPVVTRRRIAAAIFND